MQDTVSETGWRAISVYTGVTIHELRRAAATGTLEVDEMERPTVSRAALDAWLRSSELLYREIQLGADLEETLERQVQRWATSMGETA